MRLLMTCALMIVAATAALGYGLVQKFGMPTFMTARSAPTVTLPTASAATTGQAAAPTAAPAPRAAAAPAPAPVTTMAPTPARASVTPGPTAAATPPAATPAQTCPGNPNALGVARVVEIDTTGGPGFGFEHFKQHDFLRDHEVVLTFDDGPWPHSTPAVLKALADQCVKAIFFPIGKHATYYPEILKQVLEQGHSVGSHTWSHANLAAKSVQEGKDEIEKGMSAVRMSAGGPTMPFFRFPSLKHPPELVTYLGERNVAIFSTDMDSFDFKMRKGDQVVNAVMTKLKKFGKGIVLMHDFQPHTAEAVPELLKELKANGYKIVHMKAKEPLKTLTAYDDAVIKEQKLPTVSARPTSSVVRTIAE
jgi:peptidoglycan/xylan/chitin deacetylase (PgdA/CDA1 family)